MGWGSEIGYGATRGRPAERAGEDMDGRSLSLSLSLLSLSLSCLYLSLSLCLSPPLSLSLSLALPPSIHSSLPPSLSSSSHPRLAMPEVEPKGRNSRAERAQPRVLQASWSSTSARTAST
eukprot:3342354-Rhodomonas_salina.1